MTHGRGALTALHLLLVWAAMAVAVPPVGVALPATAWVGGAAATVPVFLIGVSVAVGLPAMTGLPVRTVVPLCGTARRRFGWAAPVFVLGTLGVVAAYGGDVDLGGAGTRITLTGAPYAVATALAVPRSAAGAGSPPRCSPHDPATPSRPRRGGSGALRRRSPSVTMLTSCRGPEARGGRSPTDRGGGSGTCAPAGDPRTLPRAVAGGSRG
ncbi:hypothetical protein [Streptomyces cyaneogriseus]|uniref:hypothetical protein n=1 Tax=Streptomyces cyaneogriseus TaxID=68192 RepID=UPI000A95EA31|nr:hypothetical protein [Streptomyces cyaneogriseus]